MRIAIVAVALAVSGCVHQQQAAAPAGPTTGQIERECGVGSKPFVDSWNCHKTGLPAVPVYPDIMNVYVATGDFVAEQIQTGKMSDTEGKLAMAKAKQRLKEDTELRDDLLYPRTAPQAVSRPAPVNTPMILPTAPAPDYSPPTTGWGSQPQIIYTPRGGIMCQQIGFGSVMCN